MDIEIGPEITAPAPAIRRPRTRIPHENSRLYRWLEGHPAAVAFELPEMATFALLTVDELGGLSAAIGLAIAGALGGGTTVVPAASSVAVQLANFREWFLPRTPLWHWDEVSMQNLERKARELGSVEIFGCFAMSCYVKTPSGRLVLVGRDGKETRA
jgi:hypothetical protein